MNNDPRFAGIDADMQRLLDRAADKTTGNVASFASTLLAAQLVSLRAQADQEEQKPENKA